MKIRKILASILALTMVCGSILLPNSFFIDITLNANSANYASSGTCGENLAWYFDGNDTLTISGNGTMDNWSFEYSSEGGAVSDAPWFSFQKLIRNVIIKKGVRSIGNNSFFNYSKVTMISLPDTVNDFGSNAFFNTPWLDKKIEENPLVIINNIVVDGQTCSGEISIPNTVTKIGDNAFERCYD